MLVVHCSDGLPWNAFWGEVGFTGQRGVQLFYIVSAFTLCLSLQNRSRNEAQPLRNFFLRRFFRIAPMYYIAIAISIFRGTTGKLWYVPIGMLFLQNFFPPALNAVAPAVWSIADEAMFYCCLPLLWRTVRSVRSAVVAFLTLAIPMNLLSRALGRHYTGYNHYFSFFWFPIELPVFMLGIIGFFIWKDKLLARYPPNSRAAKRLSLLLLAGTVVTYLLNLPSTDRKLLLFSFGCMLLVLALALHPWRLLVNGATVFLGRISFSIYLLHVWILIWIRQHILSSIAGRSAFLQFGVVFSAVLICTAIIATLTWRFVEEPGVQWGRRVIDHLEKRDADRASRRTANSSLDPLGQSQRDEQF